MGIFKVPRITTAERVLLVLEDAELVYDTTNKVYYGGDGATQGGYPIGSGVSKIVSVITLTQQDIQSKSVTLENAPPIPSLVSLTPEGGIPQIYGIDYTVSGNILSWNNLGLDNYLDAGETIVVSY